MSIDFDEKNFKEYWNKKYDYNSIALSPEEINEIKRQVKEKRVDYNIAPIGKSIFEYVKKNWRYIRFELVNLENTDIDGMLYIKSAKAKHAYIVINQNRPLVTQIFATAHELYHYFNDFNNVEEKTYECCLNKLESINEKKASRFAAEFLLPDEALKSDLEYYANSVILKKIDSFNMTDYYAISIILMLKYYMPLKSVLYRLHEEGYIKDISKYEASYHLIKDALEKDDSINDILKELWSEKNIELENTTALLNQIKEAYNGGYVSREEVLKDNEILGLESELLSFLDIDDEEDDDIDDLL